MIQYVEETLLRAGYAREIIFDPLAIYILGLFSHHVFKMKFDPLLIFDAIIGTKVE